MEKDVRAVVEEINQLVRAQEWFDFHVVECDFRKLVVGGSEDLTYYHKLEVVFENVFFFSGVISGWGTDTSKPMITIPEGEELRELNMRFEIQVGYQLFVILPEDFKNKIYVAAERLSYNTDTVFYYQRPDLKENERIARWVKD
ncbi:MAG: hypothetical protein JNM62_04130 [Flavobacteriales bacterium]|nr:hypothetical protein [Flavobacteriales bacterium]